MKEYRYLWKELVKKENIVSAWKKLRKHKTKRADVKMIDGNLDEEVEKLQVLLMHTKPNDREPELGFWPVKHPPKVINERGKERIIYVPDIIEQWVHHCVIQILGPIIMATASPNTCGSIPKRGMHYGKRKIERWLRTKKTMRYFLKCDIRKFFDSVRRSVAIRVLSKRIKDDWFLFVIERCLIHFEKGLPLGFYISHWIANYILEPLDYMLCRTSKTNVRYVDDIVVFGPNKRKLHLLVVKLKIFLGRGLRLKLKHNWSISKFHYKNSYRALDFMGFVFYRDRTVIRKRILFAATKCAYRIYKIIKEHKKVYIRIFRRLISYHGWFKNTNTYFTLLMWIKRYINPLTATIVVSNYERREVLTT